MELVVGIDASRSRSGGAKAHLVGILTAVEPVKFGIEKVHVWSYPELLQLLPDIPWLEKHTPKIIRKGLFWEVIWQRYVFPNQARKLGCDIVLNTDAGTVARFRPSVTMSRDALSYEEGEMKRYGFSKSRLRLILLKYVQNASLKSSQCSTFLTNYIADLIQRSTGPLQNYKVISHGVGDEFRIDRSKKWPVNGEPIKLTYVSNIAPYKHQWWVVKAVSKLVEKGYSLQLMLVGGTDGGRAQFLLDDAITECDPELQFVKQIGHIPNQRLPNFLAESDMLVFASSCETISNTLLEGMATGLPIACSNRGPMPEVLRDAGVYFDPENEKSIADAIESLLTSAKQRDLLSNRAKSVSKEYSWRRCAEETWQVLHETYERSRSE